MTTFTPGPWKVDEPHQVWAESIGEYVAITRNEDDCVSDEQVEANARLISQAPDLFALLIKARNQLALLGDMAPLSALCVEIDKTINLVRSTAAPTTGGR